MSEQRPKIMLKSASMIDWPMIRSWLALPEIQEWWGPLQTIEAEVMLALGSDHSICRIIESNGEPVGYGHAIDATVWSADLPQDLATGTWDIDLFIASERHRNLGIGAEALQQLRDEVFRTSLAVAVCVFPSIANERAVRAYEKAGFKWKSVWRDPVNGPSWFMTADRPSV